MLKEKILLITLLVGVCLALLMPFAIAPVLHFYVFGKIIIFQIIIELLMPIWIVFILISPKYRPRLNFLTSSLLIFFGVLFLVALSGIDFNRSFWGYESRMSGIFTLLHFFGFYFILSSLFKKELYKKFILFFTIGVSFFVSMLAIIENFYTPLGNFIEGEGRSMALFGNPIFLASYLLFNIFLGLFLIAKISKLKYRIILSLVVGLNVFALFLTGTRGAMVALVFGLFFICAGYFYVSKNKIIKLSLILFILFAIIFSLILVLNRDVPWVQNTPGVNRLVYTIEELSEGGGTSRTRFLIWDIAITGWKEKPILGWGPENFDIVYDKYYNPEFLNHSWYETWGDKAHNLPLEILATSGILGLASYFLIFVAIFWSIFKTKDKYKIIFAGIFIVYFIQNLFAFDSPCSLLLFFLLLAYIPQKKKLAGSSIPHNFIGFVCIIISILSIIFLNIRPALASNYALKSLDALSFGYGVGEEYFRKSMSIWSPYQDMARIKFANIVYVLVNEKKLENEEKEQAVLLAIDEIKKSALNHPRDFSYLLTLGNLYVSIGEYSLAYIEYQRALELSPKRQITYFQHASARFLAGEDDEARNILRRAVELNENVKEAHWRLGLGLLGKDDKIAIEEAEKAIKLGYHTSEMEEINAFASVFIKESDWKGLVLYYKLLIKSNKESAEIYAQLASAYLETGQKEKARDAALMAADLDTNLKEATKLFIQFLENK